MQRHFKLVLGLLVIFCLLSGCEESKTVIEPDASGAQSMVINKADGDEELPEKVENNNINFLSEMLISHHHRFVTEQIDNMIIKGYSRTSDYTDIRIFNDTEEPPRHDLELGKVNLGGVVFEKRDFQSSGIRNGISFVSTAQFAYYPEDETILTETGPLYLLEGATQFTITGSPEIQDVDTFIVIPERNSIVNLKPGAVINPNEDLVLELALPIGGSEYSYRYKNGVIYLMDQNIGNSDGASHISGMKRYDFQPSESTNTVTIPSESLQEFLEDVPDADFYVLSVFCLGEIAEIPIYDKEGNFISVVSVDFRDEYEIEIVFSE